MKMNSHSRSFIKLVQHDLLALSDASLLHLVHQWVEAAAQSDTTSDENLNNARVVLGYTFTEADFPHETVLEYKLQSANQWSTPTPPHLRIRLTDMDANQFLQHVIPLAFLSLHTEHPEWGEGMTFHAHLANYLRQKEQMIRRG
jgi:hypothetical protein